MTTTAGPRTALRVGAPVRAATRTTRTTRSGILGWISAAAITVSVLLMITALGAGASAVVPLIPRTWPLPPLWFALNLPEVALAGLVYAAIVLGAAGVITGLIAVRRGARPNLRLLVTGAVIAILVLALLPPG